MPTVLEGQLCYKLALKDRSQKGRENQLMLVLDYNEDRSLQISSSEKDDITESSKETMNFGTKVAAGTSESGFLKFEK